MKTLIIDSNCIAHQAKHSMGHLKHKDVATGTIFGFLRIIRSIAEEFQTNRLWFCWDSKKSIRKLYYPWYKEKRHKDKTPEEKELDAIAYEQFDALRDELLWRIGFRNIFMQIGYESDDLIMKLVENEWEEARTDLVVVTTDGDLYQVLKLADIYNPHKKIVYTAQDFFSDYKISPVSWAYVKAIAGCSTDEVPGVSGVGEKNAIKFLKDELKEKSKRMQAIRSEEGRALIDRNKWLVTLPLPGTKTMEVQEDKFDFDEFMDVCHEYGLNSFRRGRQRDAWELFMEGYE